MLDPTFDQTLDVIGLILLLISIGAAVGSLVFLLPPWSLAWPFGFLSAMGAYIWWVKTPPGAEDGWEDGFADAIATLLVFGFFIPFLGRTIFWAWRKLRTK